MLPATIKKATVYSTLMVIHYIKRTSSEDRWQSRPKQSYYKLH